MALRFNQARSARTWEHSNASPIAYIIRWHYTRGAGCFGMRPDARKCIRRTQHQLHNAQNVCVGAGRPVGDRRSRLDNNEFFQERVKTAVEKGLDARGLEKTTSGTADVVVHYHASVTQRVDANGVDERYGYGEDCRPFVFDAGTLTLDVVDARTNRLVWRGWAESSIDGVIDNQQWLERRIDEAVTRILERFPVRSRL